MALIFLRRPYSFKACLSFGASYNLIEKILALELAKGQILVMFIFADTWHHYDLFQQESLLSITGIYKLH